MLHKLKTVLVLILFFCCGAQAESLLSPLATHHGINSDQTKISLSMEDASSAREVASDEEEDDDFSDFDDEFGEEARQERNDVYDPWIGYNRTMFKANDWMYEKILRPMVLGFNWAVPEEARISMAKFFQNLLFPLRFINNLLQLKFSGAGVELGRFVVNTTFGLGGLFDPADHYFGWLPRNEDFGQTLAHWGVGPGPPFVIPFLGQSNLRDAFGILPTYTVHPVYHIADYEIYLAQQGLEYFNFASLHYEEYDSIKKDALDPYTFTRDAYRQSREKQVSQ